MATRTREVFPKFTEGSLSYDYGNGNTGTDTQQAYDEVHKIIDDDSPGLYHPLQIDHKWIKGGLINGKVGFTQYKDWRFFSADSFSLYNHADDPGRPTDSELASSWINKTNPSRPYVDLPTFFAELKDLPKLLKLEGDTAIKKAGSANLSYHFGMLPLFSDLDKLTRFQDAIWRRMIDISAVRNGGLVRKQRLYQGFSSDTRLVLIFPNPSYLAHVNVITKRTCWGVGTWKTLPNTINPPDQAGDLYKLARQAVLGLTVDFSTAWNLMPWSWLIDWFSNVGETIENNRNLVNAYPTDLHIMETIETYVTGQDLPSFVSPLQGKHISKTRAPASAASLYAGLPLLSKKQWSILGSIGVTRRKSSFLS